MPDVRPLLDPGSLDETTLVALARAGRRDAFREIMRRCNRRLFRVARGVVRDEPEAEDIVQSAYVHAFEHLSTFRGDSALATWLTRIVYSMLNRPFGTKS